MRPFRFFAALSAGVIVAWAALGQPALKEVIQGRYYDIRAAFDARDERALRAILAPGFKSVELDGTVLDADGMVAAMKALADIPGKTRATTVLSLERQGDAVTVKQQYEMHATMTLGDGKSHKVDLLAHSTDRWVLIDGQWRSLSTVTDDSTTWVDGEEVNHQARP